MDWERDREGIPGEDMSKDVVVGKLECAGESGEIGPVRVEDHC